ncbi:MAG: rRNA maturation RNase YbeY [Sulfurovum sp.]|nr:MAG: rRNA maturation RNase YbeY [Sulfurovum sp.]
MINIQNDTQLEINTQLLDKITLYFTKKDIDLQICDNDVIREINQATRGKDYPTDVLSFPLEGDFEHMPLGDIVISCDFVKEGAMRYNHSMDDEFALLFIHGLLHLLGFDHEIDNGEMRAKEKEVIEDFGLPASLIVRVEEG